MGASDDLAHPAHIRRVALLGAGLAQIYESGGVEHRVAARERFRDRVAVGHVASDHVVERETERLEDALYLAGIPRQQAHRVAGVA